MNKIIVRFLDFMFSFLMDFFDKSCVFSRKSYSQEGEDLILANFLEGKKIGFYVDVGAHHPFRFSNTFLFYKKGWRGINIDATPGSMDLFEINRPRDINLEIPISNSNKLVDFFIFNEPALNSFSAKLSKERNVGTEYKIKKKIELIPEKLGEVLDKYLPLNTQIDFLSIDVEGREYEVIVANNWKKHRPTYLLVEILDIDVEKLTDDKIYLFLKDINYFVVGITGRTVIFKTNE